MKRLVLMVCILGCIASAFGQICLNKAVPDGRVDSVWKAIDLPQAFTGDGVIIGFVDWGFDYTHPVFYDTNMVHYRVLRAWDQFKTAGPAPSGYDYGTEYVGAEQLLTALCDTSNCYGYHYHGTHCASIAAGAGAGTKYRGVAFDANLLFASLYLDSIQRVMDAWNWMYEVAQNEGKRLVISNSWGLYYMDNMDGTGLLANEMQRLTDLGVVFVVSAGNNGDVNFHVHHDFMGDGDTMRTQFVFPYNSGTGWGSSLTMMNSANAPFEFSMMVMNSSYQTIAATPFIPTAGNDGYVDTFMVVGNDTLIYTYDIQSCNNFNQAPVVRLRVKQNNAYKFGLAVTATSGSFHAWNVAEVTRAYGNWGANFQVPAAHPDWVAGDNEYGVSTPGNIDCAITVAAHTSRYTNNGGYLVGGQIADFSSSGPGFHAVRKPEVSAPGKNVVSAISSYNNDYTGTYTKTVEFNGRTFGFGSLSGTSMSAPFVSGVAALVLQANPYLTPAQVKEVLTSTAYQDQYTAASGINRFGYGKVDAYHAVRKALTIVGLEEHTEGLQTHYTIFPNPTSGQCFITATTESAQVPCRLYDLSGRLVRSEMIHAGVNTLHIDGLPAGCYILRIVDAQKVYNQKLIIQ
ncbi:MAG: S8 family peptidase [Bacteroidales bacterium]|nr:S8 family peptidase [Bacteroidales bacterium]